LIIATCCFYKMGSNNEDLDEIKTFLKLYEDYPFLKNIPN